MRGKTWWDWMGVALLWNAAEDCWELCLWVAEDLGALSCWTAEKIGRWHREKSGYFRFLHQTTTALVHINTVLISFYFGRYESRLAHINFCGQSGICNFLSLIPHIIIYLFMSVLFAARCFFQHLNYFGHKSHYFHKLFNLLKKFYLNAL